MNLLPLLFPLLPVLALAPRWIPQSGINLSGTISDLSTSWVTFTLSSHTAGRAEVSLICHRASAPRSAVLTRPAEWNPPWQNYMIDMSQPGNEALLIQITPNMELMLNASSAGLEDRGGDWTGTGRVPIISIKAQPSLWENTASVKTAVWTNHSGSSITEVLWHAQRN